MVTFETSVWEKDWEFLLIGDRLDQMMSRCNYPFNEKILLINDEVQDFYLGYGFSDQCYLLGMDVFKKQIYGEKNPESERYPSYGGEYLEKRIDAYMRNHKLLRITSKKVWYIHKGYPKNTYIHKLYLILNRAGLLRLHP